MFYNQTSAEVVKEGRWDEKSCIRRIGGYDIDKTNLPADMKWLPKGAVLAYNSVNGKAKLVKSAVVYAVAAKGATKIKIEKGHALVVGDVIGGNTISAINTSATAYDELTVGAITADDGIAQGAILTDAANAVILGLNYATVKLDDMPSCTPTLQAYEIQEDSLPYVIDDTIKAALTDRHAFKI